MKRPTDDRELERALRAGIRGDVRRDPLTRALYATDASIYQQLPRIVVLPADEADVAFALAVAREREVPLVPRGAGTSLSGQAICAGLVLDLSRHMNGILELDEAARWVRVQPGLVRDQLNAALAASGLQFAPETATSNRACIGGMIGNNSAGTRSLRYGQTRDHVLELTVLLPTGERLVLERLDRDAWDARARRPGREGAIYAGVAAIIEREREEIAARFPKVMRSVAGYRLDVLTRPGPRSLVDLVVGSEGTLCTVVEAKLALQPTPKTQALCAVHFTTLAAALGAVSAIVERGPSAVELLDRTLIGGARAAFGARWRCGWLHGEPAAVLLVEQCGDDAAAVRAWIAELAAALRAQGVGYAWPLCEGAEQDEVWEVRKAGLGLLAAIPGERKPTACVEDAAVPVAALAGYIDELLAFCARLDVPVTMYAHASVGLLHVRPILDLKRVDDIERLKRISEHHCELVLARGGTVSGEHGDGRVRSHLLPRLYGPRVSAAFAEIKQLFDPLRLMNPRIIVDPAPIDADLRYGPGYRAQQPATFYHYRERGSLGAAVELCTGVGACRKIGSGSMCPSYMATREERDSTRGRANALRLALTGVLPGGLCSDAVHEALAACLSCKACKRECPSDVDVARLKSEALAARHARDGARLGERFFGGSPRSARLLAGPLAPLANAVGRVGLVRAPLEHLLGVDRRRPLPAFARQPFDRWWRRRERAVRRAGGGPAACPEVALFLDTYLRYHQPAVGQAAVLALEALGYVVTPLAAGCCCRPQISKGFLAEAKATGGRTLANIVAVLDRGVPVVVCEPGCFSSLVDDLPDLVDDAQLGQRAAEGVQLIDQFLARQLAAADTQALEQRGAARAREAAARYLIHGHCHQKALVGTAAMRALLARFAAAEVREIDAGCCGMAGSFGYDREHYELSLAIAEQRLFPAIRAAAPGTRVVACGFSCRHQIHDGLGLRARHFIEELAWLIGA